MKLIKSQKIKIGLAAIFALGFLAAAIPAGAMPPHPGLVQQMSLGKAEVPYRLAHRDELAAAGLDAGAIEMLARHGVTAKVTVSGNFKILTLLVDFSDHVASVNAAEFDTLIYQNSQGCVNHYYQENSYGNLAIVSPVYPSAQGWDRAPQTYAYYANNANGLGTYPQNAQKLVEDLVDLVDPVINFAQFDNDSDGYVDGLIVVHSGPGAEFTGNNADIWSHKWSISPRLKDGVYVFTYSMNPEYWSVPGDITLGVYAHELGHVLGLPDLYDTDYSSEGVGKWSIMAGGSWNGINGSSPAHFDAWSKIFLGFVTPTVQPYDQNSVSIPQVETNSTVYKLWTNGSPANEYYLVENRQKTGYDTYLPNSGLLIWHIDNNITNNDTEWWPGSGAGSHYKVAVVQADNLWDLEHNVDSGDTGDSYPGSTVNRTFSGVSSPNSDSYAGTGTLVSVVNISNSGASMTADFAVGTPQDVQGDSPILPGNVRLLGNAPNPFNPVTTIELEVSIEASVKLEIFNLNGQRVRTLTDQVLPAGHYGIMWDGNDERGNELASGVYFYSVVSPGFARTMKMMKLK